MKKFRDCHKGKRAFIACNGPSLNDVDVVKLRGEIVFGLNRGYLKQGMPITYLVTVDPLVEEQFGAEILNIECKAVFSNGLSGPNVHRLKWTPDIPKFHGDPTSQMWQGHSVTYSAMQIAYYMGCTPVYIVGMDHYIDYSQTRKVDGKYVTEDIDVNHFDPNYFGKGKVFHHQNLKRVELAYLLARRAYERAGRTIYNASARTALPETVLPRIGFDEIFMEERK